MGNISENPFRGAFFSLIELASWDFEKCVCVPNRGIGLAVSRFIVEPHAGRFWAENNSIV